MERYKRVLSLGPLFVGHQQYFGFSLEFQGRIRKIAHLTCLLISLAPSLGNITQLMTRHLYFLINNTIKLRQTSKNVWLFWVNGEMSKTGWSNSTIFFQLSHQAFSSVCNNTWKWTQLSYYMMVTDLIYF